MSTPTVSRFENGEKNIQLASVLAILGALGLLEQPSITFPDRIERYDPDRDLVLFPARTPGGEITCAVSGEALKDRFGTRGGGEGARLSAFRVHRDEIEAAVRRKYEAGRTERDGSLLIRSSDLRPPAGSQHAERGIE